MDTRKRSIIKAISWRIIASLCTVLIGVIITGSAKVALIIGGIDVIVKFVAYYLHERGWQRIKWGKD